MWLFYMIVKEFGQLMAIEGMIKVVDIKISCEKPLSRLRR